MADTSVFCNFVGESGFNKIEIKVELYLCCKFDTVKQIYWTNFYCMKKLVKLVILILVLFADICKIGVTLTYKFVILLLWIKV